MTDAATHIRRFFLEPKETYSVRDAAEILCMPLPDVLGWMQAGELEGVDTPHGLMLSWGELADFGMGFWPQEAQSKPTSPTPSPSSSAWPAWKCASPEILALEYLAGRDGKSVDAVLARELLGVVSANSEYLAKAIPGVTAALRWPQ